ncbi:MAG: MFS transporter, partial [Planctomycetes bacterium]|nr:MFS transporter [Planctomycetota bacterium]
AEIVIKEGRNRQVRRMIEAVGSEVVDLERIAIGPIRIGDLRPGGVRPLRPDEIRGLYGSRKGLA